MLTELPMPDWTNLIGGEAESQWLADRDRKFSLILDLSRKIIDTESALRESGNLFNPTPEILESIPFAVDWYLSLAGFSLKTLENIKEAPSAYGVKRKLATIRSSLLRRRCLPRDELIAVTGWLKDELDDVWPWEGRSNQRAIVFVSAILGGRAIGQGQNAGGDEAILLLKTALVDFAERNDFSIEGYGGVWQRHTPDKPAILSRALRFDGNLVGKFPSGGDTPDVIFTSNKRIDPLAVGEVKGRKDTSNVWESWMPQVVDHMRTWSNEFEGSARLFFGTLINTPMIDGESIRGTGRAGLRGLYEEGHLNGVYNLSKISNGVDESLVSFDALVRSMLDY